MITNNYESIQCKPGFIWLLNFLVIPNQELTLHV